MKENWFKLGILAAILLFTFRISDVLNVVLQFVENSNPNVLMTLTLAASVVGWFVVSGLGLRQQKQQLRNEAQMKVYEELYSLKKNIDKQGIILGLALRHNLPFLEMSFKSRNPNKVEGNSQALSIWLDYVSGLSGAIYEFYIAYQKRWADSEMWIAVMPQLNTAMNELFEVHLNNLSKELSEHMSYLQKQSTGEWYWEKWNRGEIERKAKEISDLFNELAIGFIDDYMGLIHNRLVASIFGYRKKPRETFANLDKVASYRILTEQGEKEVISKQKPAKEK